MFIMVYLPYSLTEAVFDEIFALNPMLTVYDFPLTNLHGVAVQSVISSDTTLPKFDPQSVNGTDVHTKFNE